MSVTDITSVWEAESMDPVVVLGALRWAEQRRSARGTLARVRTGVCECGAIVAQTKVVVRVTGVQVAVCAVCRATVVVS